MVTVMNSVAMNIFIRLFLSPLFVDKQINMFLVGMYLELELLYDNTGLASPVAQR